MKKIYGINGKLLATATSIYCCSGGVYHYEGRYKRAKRKGKNIV